MHSLPSLVLLVVGLHLIALAFAGAIFYWALHQKVEDPNIADNDDGNGGSKRWWDIKPTPFRPRGGNSLHQPFSLSSPSRLRGVCTPTTNSPVSSRRDIHRQRRRKYRRQQLPY